MPARPTIVAWHMMTVAGRERREAVFTDIVKRGFLVPSKMRTPPARERRDPWADRPKEWRKRVQSIRWHWGIPFKPGREATVATNTEIKDIDRLAGDHKFVFLSLAPHRTSLILPELYWKDMKVRGMTSSYEYGFGFDALELIARGAVVGKKDLLQDYERAVKRVAARVFAPVVWRYKYRGDADYKEEAAFYAHRFTEDQNVNVLLRYIFSWKFGPELFQEIAAVQRRFRYRGDAAVTLAVSVWKRCLQAMKKAGGSPYAAGPSSRCGLSSAFSDIELLFPRPIPVAWAKYVILNGELGPASEALDMRYQRSRLASASANRRSR